MRKNVTFFLVFLAADQLANSNRPATNSPQYQSPQPTYYQSNAQYDRMNTVSEPYNNRYAQSQSYYNQAQSQPSYYQTNPQSTMANQPSNMNDNSGRMGPPNPNAAMDQEVGKKIRDLLSSGQFTKGYLDLSYRVQNGNVIVKGYANSPENRNKIEEAIRKIPGVKDVDNRIFLDRNSPTAPSNLPPEQALNTGMPVSDQALINAIQDKLSTSWFTKEFKNVTVAVDFGVVDLGGTIDTQADKEKVEDIVKNINGVKQVNNNIMVKSSSDETPKKMASQSQR